MKNYQIETSLLITLEFSDQTRAHYFFLIQIFSLDEYSGHDLESNSVIEQKVIVIITSIKTRIFIIKKSFKINWNKNLLNPRCVFFFISFCCFSRFFLRRWINRVLFRTSNKEILYVFDGVFALCELLSSSSFVVSRRKEWWFSQWKLYTCIQYIDRFNHKSSWRCIAGKFYCNKKHKQLLKIIVIRRGREASWSHVKCRNGGTWQMLRRKLQGNRRVTQPICLQGCTRGVEQVSSSDTIIEQRSTSLTHEPPILRFFFSLQIVVIFLICFCGHFNSN